MSSTLRIPNYTSLNNKGNEKSRLMVATNVGDTIFRLENNNGIDVNDYLLIGTPGAERSELKAVLTVSGPEIATATPATFNHAFSDMVTLIFGNQIKLYRAAAIPGSNKAPADELFSAVGDPVDLNYDQSSTDITDPDGSSEFWFKFVYFNSLRNVETKLSDSVAVRGGSVGQYVSIDEIRNEAGFKNNSNITDDLIDSKRRIAQDQINGSLYGRYSVPFAAPVNGIIRNMALQLATAYVKQHEYGAFDEGSDEDEKLKRIMDQLESIKSGQLVLLDNDHNSLETDTGGGDSGSVDLGFSGWPNRTTAALAPTEEGAGDFMFKRSSIDGYESRIY